MLANEWAIEKNTGSKTLGEFLNGKITEGKLSSVEDNGNGTYTVKLNRYQTIIDQNGKISSVFNPEEWDKTATPEDCFIWGSDTSGEEGYDVIIGYTDKLESYTKLVIPSRCTKIDLSTSYTNIANSSSRSFCSSIKAIELPSTVTEITNWAFSSADWDPTNGFGDLESVIIPDSVTNIGKRVFANCTKLSSMTIPNSVTSIGGDAFRGCTNLNSITIPSSVTSIEYSAFNGCISLSSIEIPSSVTSIESGAFRDCTNLSNIIIPDTVTNIGIYAFDNTAWYNSQPDGVVYVGKVLYNYKGTMPSNISIQIKEGTIGIANGAFRECTNLNTITIPSSITTIEAFAFSGWTSSQTINIEEYTSAPSGWSTAWNGSCSATINWGQ